MNDSLNMITKSRNKLLNKSLQQNGGNSSGNAASSLNRGANSSSASKMSETLTNNLSLRKLSQQQQKLTESSNRKLNTTSSQDILAPEQNQLEDTYGKLHSTNFVQSVKGSRNNITRAFTSSKGHPSEGMGTKKMYP